MERLPVEILSHIFSYLSVSDRQECALVNQQWYDATQHPALRKTLAITLHGDMKFIQSLPPHVYITRSSSLRSFIQSNLTGRVKMLSLKGLELTEGVLLDILNCCPSLVSLDLTCCNDLFMTSGFYTKSPPNVFPSLKRINLSSIRHLADGSLKRLLTMFPNLEGLSVASNHMISHSEAYCGSAAIETLLTFRNMINFIKERATSMKSFDFSRTSISIECLKEIANIKNLRLKEVFLVCCRELDPPSLVHFVSTVTSLETLDLSYCIAAVDNSVVAAICVSIPGLKELKLNYCHIITKLSGLRHLKNLEVLELTSDYALSPTSLQDDFYLPKSLQHVSMIKLTHLSLNYVTTVNDDVVAAMVPGLSVIQLLDLSCTQITDKALQKIFETVTTLQVLKVGKCKEISDVGFIGVLRDAESKMPESEVMDSKLLSKSAEKDMEKPNVANVNQLLLLRELDVSSCPKLTDAFLGFLRPPLTSLNISLHKDFTDNGLQELISHITSLEQLYLSQCHSIGDQGVITAVKNLKRLRVLDISDCHRISDATLMAILQHSRRLRHLDVSLCAGITINMIYRLENNMTGLRSIHKRLSGNIV